MSCDDSSVTLSVTSSAFLMSLTVALYVHFVSLNVVNRASVCLFVISILLMHRSALSVATV